MNPLHNLRSLLKGEQAEAGPRPGRADNTTLVHANQHVIVSATGTTAWYLLGEVDWQYRSDSERDTVLAAQAARWADLSGHRVTLRATSAPFNRAGWVNRLSTDFPTEAPTDGSHRSVRLPDREGSWTFNEQVGAAQQVMLDMDARASAVFLGVRLTPDRLTPANLRKVLWTNALTEQDAGLDKLRRDLARVTSVVGKRGLDGDPATPKMLAWLIYASTGLGLTVPSLFLSGKSTDWVGDDVPEFMSGVTAANLSDSPYSTVHAVRNGVEQTSHVTVMHATKFGPRDANGMTPAWLSWFQQLDYSVDVVAQFDLIPPAELREEAEKNTRTLDDQITHYAEHDRTASSTLLQSRQRATEVEAEVSTGDRGETRARGVVMVAVTAATTDGVREVADSLMSAASSEVGITLAIDIDQYHSMRGFIPGEPIRMLSHVRQLPVDFLAAGVPNSSSRCGDGQGWFVGPVGGGHDVMLWNTHGGSDDSKSNLTVVGAAPGVAGKSTLGGALLDWGARCGEQTLGLDPAGQWWRLCDLPHLKSDARHFDLLSARGGILTPSTLILDPREHDYATRSDYLDDVENAKQDRMELMMDTLRDLLPYGLTSGKESARVSALITKGVMDVGGGFGEDPWQIIDKIGQLSDGGGVAEMLTAAAGLKAGRLIFPPKGREVDASHDEITSATLTIITLKGLELPPKDNPDKSQWNRRELQAIPVLNLSSRLALTAMRASTAPTNIMMDEMSMVTGGSGGNFGQFLSTASVDSRKWNCHVGLFFQSPSMLTAANSEISNLVGSAWIGHMGRQVAKAALPLLNLPADSGAEDVITSLGQGEWLVRDWSGRVRMVRVDRSWWDPATFKALDTNPRGEGRSKNRGIPGIFDDDEVTA